MNYMYLEILVHNAWIWFNSGLFVVMQVDIPKMVSEKLIKAGLQHLHVYLEARKHCE